MKDVHAVWKPASILVCLIALGGLALGLFDPTLQYYFVAGALTLASVGTLQFAFGWPVLPRILWRTFGPLFSIALIWPLAGTVGYLATRLAIIHLSLADWAITAGMLVGLSLYTLAIVMPLYRLGEWGAGRKSNSLSELRDTFA